MPNGTNEGEFHDQNIFFGMLEKRATDDVINNFSLRTHSIFFSKTQLRRNQTLDGDQLANLYLFCSIV